MTDLTDVLSDKDFGLRMRFEKGDIASFFRPGPSHAAIIAERRKWISETPETCAAILPEGVASLDETVRLAVALGTLPDGQLSASLDPLTRCQRLGELWESDFILMKPDDAGIFRLQGGCLCFPSHWDLREKLGLSMADVHAPVPGLNETLGRQIDGFLLRIKPGISWERANWGLARTPELNLHPTRKLPRLDSSVTLDEVWFRLEQQSLVALPESGAILFGIKLLILPLAQIKADPSTRQGMTRALETMPEPMATYKGIAPARERLLAIMESA